MLALTAFRQGSQVGLWTLLTSGDECQIQGPSGREMTSVDISAVAPAVTPVMFQAGFVVL